MTIDRYRLNWRDLKDRKQVIDDHLAEFRSGDKPGIAVPLINIIMAHVLVGVVIGVVMFFSGYSKGYEDAKAEPRRTEYVSPATKCTSWDVVGNQKRCMTWKRVL